MMRDMNQKVRIWDLPLRLFHWLLVAMFALAWWSSGHPQYLDLHLLAGYTIAALLLFRVVWGVIGTEYARFRSFAYGPKRVVNYLRDLFGPRTLHPVGHNPAGAWAIFAMLLLLLAITLSGLVVLGGEEGHGPLADMVSLETGIAWHEPHEWLAWTMLVLVMIHLLGVAVESILHRDNLVAAMISGKKAVRDVLPRIPNYRWLAAMMVMAWLGTTAVAALPWLRADVQHPYQPFAGKALPDNATWRNECGGCHQAYHPQLLPARSWHQLLVQQDDHFGESLGLDEATIAELMQFHETYAADHPLMEAAWYMTHTLKPDAVPLRITETPYWRKMHSGIPETIWRDPQVNGRGNCAACHSDAERNTFSDAAMRLPHPKP